MEGDPNISRSDKLLVGFVVDPKWIKFSIMMPVLSVVIEIKRQGTNFVILGLRINIKMARMIELCGEAKYF